MIVEVDFAPIGCRQLDERGDSLCLPLHTLSLLFWILWKTLFRFGVRLCVGLRHPYQRTDIVSPEHFECPSDVWIICRIIDIEPKIPGPHVDAVPLHGRN